MNITAIGTQKGGTGKTTMTFNLAGVLAENKRVLCIDMDPQCNLSNNLGIDITIKNSFSSRDIFENSEEDPNNLVVYHPVEQLPNLDIIPSNIYMFETELVIINRAARERILVNYIEDNLDFFKQYDHILIDTNPSMSILNQNAFLAADSLILVTDADDNSKVGLELFMHLWGRIRRDLRKPDNVKALILNRAKLDTNTTRDILDYFHKHDELGPLLIPQIIRAKEVYKNAAANRVPINMLKPSDKAKKKDILEASGEIRKAVEYLVERGIF